jgi:hypothetical protein
MYTSPRKLVTIPDILVLFIPFVIAMFSCNLKKDNSAIHYPTERYEYVSIDTSKAIQKNIVYVPIYSHMYMINGTRPTLFAATLSIRSTDFSDSIFVTNVDYYNSNGRIIKKYIDKTLLLKPMHSSEFIVEESDTQGGAGAYFIINWLALKPVNEPLIQAIMLSTTSSLGFSFKTEGIKLNREQ